VLRASLDRLNAFVDELGDYGDPNAVWAEGDLELLLREAIEQLRPGPAAGVELRLELQGRCAGQGRRARAVPGLHPDDRAAWATRPPAAG